MKRSAWRGELLKKRRLQQVWAGELPRTVDVRRERALWGVVSLLCFLLVLSVLLFISLIHTLISVYGFTLEDPASLIDIFLFTNVFACFIEPFVIRNFGLRVSIVGAAVSGDPKQKEEDQEKH